MTKLQDGQIVVTGGAGFIGSALVWALNLRGIDNILVVDRLHSSEKWKNLVPLRFADYMDAMVAGGTVRVGPRALDLGRLVVRPRVLRLPGPVFVPLEIVTAGLLPKALREQYGLAWGRSRQRLYRLTIRTVPRVVAMTPPVLRVWPLPGRNVSLGWAMSP